MSYVLTDSWASSTGYNPHPLTDFVKGEFLAFRVARDIHARLAELRELLGESQEVFALRFARGWKQVSAWENQRQAPPPSVLAWAASRNGWPVEIFAKGGPMPKAVINAPKRPVEPRSVRETVLVPTSGRQALEILELRMRLAVAEGRIVTREEQMEWLRLAQTAREEDEAGDAAG